jgi:hypothetical protein
MRLRWNQKEDKSPRGNRFLLDKIPERRQRNGKS